MAQSTPTARPISELINGPDDVAAALETFRRDLISAAGENLKALILTGSLARGQFRPNRSDVNVVILLDDSSCASLDAVAPVLRSAWRAVRLEPMIMTSSEAGRLADVFPVKVVRFQTQYVTLYGVNPFVDIVIEREHLRLRAEQQLRNLLMRLRRRYIAVSGDPAGLCAALVEASGSLEASLLTVLRLLNKDSATGDSRMGVFQTAAAECQLDYSTLERLAALRGEDDELPEDAGQLYQTALEAIERVIQIVDRLEPQE